MKMTDFRVGQGYDVHAYGEGDHVVLGGVRIAHERGVVAQDEGYVWSSDPRLTLPTLQRFTETQVRELIAGIECPTRVIFANPPQVYLPEPLRSERAGLLPQGERIVMDGTHHLHMETPVAVARAIKGFFH